ncbi:hypothetical protein VE04_01316 [Pseudogymnoascus sp. 24MN13]|nr:hypothetical protein VE04_01316 [Pseudogymnoascus sp. 24MN13]
MADMAIDGTSAIRPVSPPQIQQHLEQQAQQPQQAQQQQEPQQLPLPRPHGPPSPPEPAPIRKTGKQGAPRHRASTAPVSKAYTTSLTERISLLEGMLKEYGAEPPAADHPPITKAEAARGQQSSPEASSRKSSRPTAAIPQSQTRGNVRSMSQNRTTPKSLTDEDGEVGGNSPKFDVIEGNSPKRIQDPRRESLVDMLVSTRGHMSFDQLSGCLRFFGPTTNYHIYAAHEYAFMGVEPPEQARRTERIIRSLPMETHDYLMGLFWEYYNTVLHIVHKEAFTEDRENSGTKYYSGFLHICILAIGYRYADTEREDIKKITVGQRESFLHREAKYMLDIELERPGGLTSVQAFLLLGDLECGVGRDNTGWMFAGMANRLCFDIGLHLDCGNEDLPEKEIQIRNMTLFACVIYDKYWALFLGRPTGIKSSDLEMYRLANQFSSLELMEISSKIIEIEDPRVTTTQAVNDNAYLQVMNLDRQLQTWYRRLPEKLAWKPANIQTNPFSFFLLHQQYHCSLILLHRPWAKYEDQIDSDKREDDFSKVDNDYFYMSRSTCTRQAVRVAQVFWHHRQSLDIRKCFVTGLQHAGTAATALVAAIAVMTDVDERKKNMKYLECLATALHDMGPTYYPADSMSNILQAVMVELSESREAGSPMESTLKLGGSQRHESPSQQENSEQRDFKRRASSKSMTRPEISEFSRPIPTQAPPSFNQQADNNNAIENHNRVNSYNMITPQSDGSVPRPLSIDGQIQNRESMTQQMEYPFGVFGFDLDSMHDGSMWNGASGPLALFQEDLTGLGDEQWSGDRNNQELDFLAL